MELTNNSTKLYSQYYKQSVIALNCKHLYSDGIVAPASCAQRTSDEWVHVGTEQLPVGAAAWERARETVHHSLAPGCRQLCCILSLFIAFVSGHYDHGFTVVSVLYLVWLGWFRILPRKTSWVRENVVLHFGSNTPCFRKKHPLILLAISWGIVVWF